MNDVGLLIARIMIAWMFVASGYGTLMNIPGATSYFSGLGLPLPFLLAIVVGLFEIAAGALLIVGFQTRIVAAVLAVFCLVATWLGHVGQGSDQATVIVNQQMVLKDIAVAGGLILLALFSGGRLSLESWLARRDRVPPVASA